jgi:methylmalonyl-CoA/ethylmalonyl-CoA epimerase
MTDAPFGKQVVAQIAIAVKDIEAAVETYSKIFGIEKPNIIITDEYDKAQTLYRGGASHARAKLAFIKFGQVELELIEPIGEPSVWKDLLDQKGEGVHHIAFWVPDTDETVKYLDAHGMPMIQQGQFDGGQYTYVDSEPQLGVMLELLENFNEK